MSKLENENKEAYIDRIIKYRSKLVIMVGFTVVMCLLVTLAAISANNFRTNQKKLTKLTSELESVGEIFVMRDAAYQRAFLLNRMADLDDPFKRQELFEQFMLLAERYIKARDKMLAKNTVGGKARAWAILSKDVADNAVAQQKAAELVLEGKSKFVKKELADKIFLTQDKVMRELTHLFDAERMVVNTELNELHNKNRQSFIVFIILTAIGVLIGSFVSIAVARRINRTEDILVEQSDRVRALYKLSANPNLNVAEQIDATLRLGCKIFGTEIAKVCVINEEQQTNTFLYVVADEGADVCAGTVLPLERTFCSIVFIEGKAVALDYVGKSKYNTFPCYEFSHLETYFATPIYVNGKKYGTVNFSSRGPREKAFSESEIDIINLIGGWISVALEREMIKDDMGYAKEAAELASQTKSDFLANMSHEIRTPLTAILGYSETLLDQFQTELERTHAVQAIMRGGEHLQQIINDILDLSKIEAQQLDIELLDVPLRQLIYDVNLVAGNRAREKNLDFVVDYHYPIPRSIMTDPTRLKQILINICSNAVKFTEKGGIHVDVSYMADLKQMQFVITDTGIGMNKDEMDRLFVAFSQADASTTRKYGGTGLGLCISQQLANKLGGSITCNSVKGQGSAFALTIASGVVQSDHMMVDDSEAIEEGDEEKSSLPSKLSGKVLLAEDSIDNQKLISMFIRRSGASVVVAENGQVAVNLVREEDFDLILMDMQMPIMGGLEATKCLREFGCKTPVVALTANAMKSDRKKYIEVGADDYLTKPLDLDKFYETLTLYLNHDKSEEDKHSISAEKENKVDRSGQQEYDYLDDPEFQELVYAFVEMLPAVVEEIASATRDNDWATLQAASHRLKGAGGSYGFPELTEVSRRINDSVRAEQYEDIPKPIEELKDMAEKIQVKFNSRKAS